MARGSDLLDDKTVKAKTAPGHYRDGRGLFLQVSKWGTKSWVFRYTSRGKARGMGLGSYEDVSLKAARNEVDKLRVAVREGRDPVEERRALNAAPEVPNVTTFADALDEYMKSGKIQKFRSEKHRKQWRASLDLHVCPKIGAKDVGTITIDDVKGVLKPVWATKTDTARRVRQRCSKVFDWAIDEGCRKHDNPASISALATWIENQGEAETQNRPAIQQDDLPTWFAALGKREGMAARALEFVTYCASRSGEVRGATWGEIDFQSKVFTIPAARMKVKKNGEHRVPLSDAAVALLKSLPNFEADHSNPNALIFPAPRGGEMSDATMSAVMKRMHEAKVKKDAKGWIDVRLSIPENPDEEPQPRPAVPHGLRSTFKDWAAKRGFDNIQSELALAHNVGNEVERRYRRDDLVEERRAMMNAFAAFCRGEEAEASKVVPLRAGVA
ncbi:tyrosine-type recombinase/integrase [Thalassovita taeanensis]|uniref:Integrase n=1 Tax=Thalassovita taeanensis TaxID=657014 RepID=A0A1H9JVS2_9RHOB|nr:site-specific integrase [Thalassovita taeanensis]SEQ90874.1 Integrase [Thalassovita taeanensis]